MGSENSEVLRILATPPDKRSSEELIRVHNFLGGIEGLQHLRPRSQREAALQETARLARLMRVRGESLLFRRGDPASAWFILLSGCVLIDHSMFLPRSCFGTRLNGSQVRHQDCFVLEDSDLVAIAYVDRDPPPLVAASPRTQLQPASNKKGVLSPVGEASGAKKSPQKQQQQQHTPERQSSLSESDSAIARTMTTTSNSSNTSLHCAVGVDSDSDLDGGGGGDGAEDDDGGGSDVDNEEDEDDEEEEDEDDEFDSGSSSHESLRDSFWDALLKEPRLRTTADVEVLVENVQKLPAFSNLSEGTRTALCRLMLVAVVREASQVVLSDGEILDTWSVILNGTVEVVDPDGTIRELTSGDAFGVRLPPSPNADGAMSGGALVVQRHRGQMRTVTEDCQFVCVAQADYFRIMAQAADAEVPEVEEDGGRVVLVYEDIRKDAAPASTDADVPPLAPLSPSSAIVSRVVIKGTPEKLIDHLKSPESSDPSYPEDLLLTYRTFLPTPALLVRRLLTWWEEALPADRILRSRIQRYVVLWVHNHPADFYDRPAMLHFLETFSDLLQRDSGNRRLLHLACSTRARPRTVSVTLTLIVAPGAACHIVLPCVLVGGQGEFGIFVNQAEEVGGATHGGGGEGYEVRPALRRADQLLALQQTSVDGLSLAQLASMLASLVLSSNRQPPGTTTTRTLTFSVIFNPSQFYELMSKVGELNSRLTSKNRATVISTRDDHFNAFEVASIQEGLSLINASSRAAGTPSSSIDNWMERQQQQKCQRLPGEQSHLVRGAVSLRYPPGAPHPRSPLPPVRPSATAETSLLPSTSSDPSSSSGLTRSSSQPDLTITGAGGRSRGDQPQGAWWGGASSASAGMGEAGGMSVIRVWRSLGAEAKDQVSKLVPLHPRTIARTAVRLAAQEFSIDADDVAAEFCLCLVTVDEGPIMKQSRIADNMDDLANRTALNSRYYLKPNRVSDVLITDEVAKVIYQESRVSLTQLSPEEVAIQLTLDDFSIFRSIEAAEFVDKVFGLTPPASSALDGCSNSSNNENIDNGGGGGGGFATGCANLDAFADVVNKEAYWVPSELCAETSLPKRVDMLKRFIKIAKLCRDLRNFNTMFCILVGLHMSPVERLRQTWERLPNKYVKMSRDLALVLDPSRNFAHYRNLLTSPPQSPQTGAQCLPLVPYLPLVLKDLTFIHLGNPSRSPATSASSSGCPQLINFAKLRMFAKEIRSLRRMCDIEYDLPLAQRLLQSGGTSNKFSFLLAPGGVSGSATTIDISSPQQQHQQPSLTTSSASNISTASASSATDSVNNQDSHIQPKKSSDGGGVVSLMSGATSLLLSTASGAGSSPTRMTVPNLGGVAWGGMKKAKVKAMYAAWQMRLRVRTYMAGLRVTEDLDRLAQLSHRAESGGATSKEATPTPTPAPAPPPVAVVGGKSAFVAESPPLKSQLPPTPPQVTVISTAAAMVPTSSATATISSHRSIFGNQSIEDARKLIALQERTSRRRMRMCAVPTYPQQQHYHHYHQQLLHPQQYCHYGVHYQHYLSNGVPAYVAGDQRTGQRGRYLPPTTTNVYHLQLHQQHQQYRQQQQQQQTSAMAAAQWVARQQQMALPSQQRSRFHSPPPPPPPPPAPPPPPPQHSMPPKQPPAYDYAMILKMQQQQQQQQQMRNVGGFVRRSSEPPPRGGVGGPPRVTSPALVHRHPSPQGAMQRPPLPSYHEVVAMKQHQQHLGASVQPLARGQDGRPVR